MGRSLRDIARISPAISLLILVPLGCSESEAGDGGDETGGSSGATATGGTSGASGAATGGSSGTAGSGPPITSAPPAWVRPSECGGVGNLCPNLSGCAELSTCQLEGNVCIPSFDPSAGMLPSRTAATPYCAAYTCMTFEQASCFCTGEAGAMYPDCSSPSALAGLCNGERRTCTASSPCCSGLSCVDRGSFSVCERPCTTGAECESGCCTDRYDSGTLSCADADACANPCKKQGETCTPGTSTTPNDCCQGSCVESTNPDFSGCRRDCTTNADCDTGCCQLYADSTNGFCAAPLYCTCNPPSGACGPGNPECCEGSTCAGFDETSFSCYQACTTAPDCPTNCCVALEGGGGMICLGPEYCP